MKFISSLFTDSNEDVLIMGSISLAIFIIAELTFLILMRSLRKKDEAGSNKNHGRFLKILRTLFRFFMAFALIRVFGKNQEMEYPRNLLFDATGNALLIAGVVTALYQVIKLLVDRAADKNRKNEIRKNLLSLSFTGIRRTLFLLSFSLFIWTTVSSVPLGKRDSPVLQIVLLTCGMITAGAIILVLRKSFASLTELLEERQSLTRVAIIVKSLSVPFQILILNYNIFWLKAIIPGNIRTSEFLEKSNSLLLLTAVLIFFFKLVEIFGSRISSLSEKETNSLDKSLVEMTRMLLRISLCLGGIFGFFQIITGKPLNTLLAGLGIGGLALALAAQDTLKNFFGSLMIMTDKPFKIGERIQIKDYDGVIESIGFRSTRIRTLVGHQVIIPNDQMASESVENIGRRPYIRRLTNITLTYGTTPDKIERALSIIKEMLDQHEGMPADFPPRVYFNDFNADSLNIMMIYWYSPPNYWDFMDFSQRINLQIMKRFEEEEIEFAFPTSTTYLEQSEGNAIKLELSDGLPPHDKRE